MLNFIILSKNYENYSSGYYHQDLIDSFTKKANCFLYGNGYPNYNKNDAIEDVIAKSPFNKSDIDLIVVSTSWELQNEVIHESDPHPNIILKNIKSTPTIFFLNKEYKKLDKKLEYIKRNQFDLVCTVHPNYKLWQKQTDINFIQLPFGISFKRFKYLGLKRKYDFGFTGNLHASHTNLRLLIKREIFDDIRVRSNRGLDVVFRSNPLKKEYRKYKIYWAEWGARDIFFRSLLPTGEGYARFLNQFKVFLNTLSAVNIFNTRFFELMAVKTLILCSETDKYQGILENRKNCLMFKPDMSNFRDIVVEAIENHNLRKKIVDNAAGDVKNHSYDERVKIPLGYFRFDN